MFVSFINRDTGLDVSFDSADVKTIQKTIFLPMAHSRDARYGTDVTLRDGTVVALSDQFDTVVNALRMNSVVSLVSGDPS